MTTFKVGDLVWKRPGAGMVGVASFIKLAQEEPDPWTCTSFYSKDEAEYEAHLANCRERWADAMALPGETLAEARQADAEGRYLGMVYHLNDCDILADRPQVEEGS